MFHNQAGEKFPFGGNFYPGEQKITRTAAKRPNNREVTAPPIALETCPGGIGVKNRGERQRQRESERERDTGAYFRLNLWFLTTDQVSSGLATLPRWPYGVLNEPGL